MKNPVCEKLLQYQPTNTENENLRSWYIVISVFNAFLAFSAISLNSLTIQALRKTSSLPKLLKTLLLSLAVSDLGVGLLVQPFYLGILVKWLLQYNLPEAVCTAYHSLAYLFSGVSFFGVMVLSGDRFLAVFLHLRYQELVTYKRVAAVVISVWVISAVLSFSILTISLAIYSYIMILLGVLGATLLTMVYIRIYLTVRRHKSQIQVQQVQQMAHADQAADFASLIKSAVGIFYVYFVFLVCYVPDLICLVVTQMIDPNIVLKGSHMFSLTLVFLNSTLNPVIYCWKMRHIRNAVMNMLRKMFRQRNRPSHETLPLAGHTVS